MNYKLIDIKIRGDERGNLVVFEKGENCPFEIRRTYCIFGVSENTERGFHAHKKLEQIAVCLAGSCDFVMDDGKTQKTFHLNSCKKGLLIPSKCWHYMKNFSKDCVLLVLASEHYDENDYIRNYQDYLESVKNG